MRDCTVMLDGRTVIEHGRIVDPHMAVAREQRSSMIPKGGRRFSEELMLKQKR